MARLLIGILQEPGYDFDNDKNGGKFDRAQHYIMEFRFKVLNKRFVASY